MNVYSLFLIHLQEKQKLMRLRTFLDRRHYKSQLQLIVEAHRIHVIRRNNDAEELQDLKLVTARELESYVNTSSDVFLLTFLQVDEGDELSA